MSYKVNEHRYKDMQYNRCGTSGLKISPITLGLWKNFGDDDSFSQGRKLIRHAFDQGITHFDLANNYGPPYGSAEKNLGRILKKDFGAHRDEMIIATKAGFDMWEGPYGDWGSRKYLLASLDQSLKRMGLDYVDVFYHHRPDPDTPLEETLGAVATAVKQGKALYAGVSRYDGELHRKAVEFFKSERVPFILNQSRYSLLDRTIETNGLMEVASECGSGIIAFSPLAQGVLSGKYSQQIPGDSRITRFAPAKSLLTVDNNHKVSQLLKLAEKRGESPAALAIAWVLRREEVTSALIGARTISQLDDNLSALNLAAFTDDEITFLDS